MPPDISQIRAFTSVNLDTEIHSGAGHNPVQAPTSLGSRTVTWFKEVFGSGRREARIFKNDTLNAIKMAYGDDVANLVAQMHKSELSSSSALTGRSTLNLIGTAESLAAKRLHFNVINARKFAEEFVRSTNPGVGGSKRPLTPPERQLVRDVVEEVARNPALMSRTLTKESIFHLANQIQLRNLAATLVPNVPVPTPSTDTSLNYDTAGRPRRRIVDNPPLILTQPGVKEPGVRLKFETDLEQNPDKFSFTPPGSVVERSLGNDVTTARTNLQTLCGNDDAFVTRVSELANSHLLDEGVQLGKTQMETQLGGGTLGDPTSLPGRPSKEVHLEQMQDGSVKITLKNVTAFSKLSGGGVDVPLDPEKNYVRDKVTIILSPDPNVPPQFSTSTAIHTELPDGFQMGVGGPVDLGENIDQVTTRATLGNRRGPVEKALSDVLKTPELLEQFPTGEDVPEHVSELTSHRELLQARLQSLEAHGDTDSGVGRLAKSLKSEIREQIRQIDNHISYVQRASGGNTTSRARLSNQVYMVAKGMSLYLGALYSTRLKGGADASTLQRIEQLRKEMEDLGAQQLDVERGNVAPVTNPKREVERMVAPIKRRFEQGLKELGLEIPEKELQTCFFNYALGRQQKWEKYSNGVSLFGQQFTSTITPGSKQEHLREDYGDLEGAPSGDKFESTHATALAHTEFFDNNGGKLFEAERRGVLCAWGIEDEDERRVANKNRALEVVKSAFTNDPILLQQALLNPDQPVNLTISSLSLLTPDIFRGGDGNERLMLRGQAQAWEDVSGIQTFRIRNPANGQWVNVNVNVQPVAFNFGVNQGGVSGFGPISSDGSMGGSSMLGWGMADEMNQQGLETLLGQNLDPTTAPGGIVGPEILRLQNGNQQEQQRAIHLRTLSDQIRTMWQDQSHRRDEGEAYKMVSRLALLSHMAGIKVAFNCKSGKDRTGNLDTEVKFLAAYIAVRNVVPPPGTPLTVLEQTDLRNLSKKSGSRYWQLLNTGVEGYKLKGVPSIPTRIGGPVAYSDFLGASDATHE
jgi:hypothetical protein